ncbi:hypothetical protein HAX54_037191, partial [Datura stramonium]|nr:hypothetical protein [Datura stramonium]
MICSEWVNHDFGKVSDGRIRVRVSGVLSVNCRTCPAKCLMKRRSRCEAAGQYQCPAFHWCFAGQDQQIACVASIQSTSTLFSAILQWFIGVSQLSPYVSL